MNFNETKATDNYLSDLLAITKIGTWDCNLQTGAIIYSAAWAEILGYSIDELDMTTETWQKMVIEEDLEHVKKQIERHTSGEIDIYEVKIRMRRKDGIIIWVQDKGKIIEYDDEGRPLRFVGVLQDITPLKETEERLRENQATLDLALNIAELGTWDWDIVENVVQCNDAYLQMLGYPRSEFLGTIEEWIEMIYSDDRARIMELVNDYMTGKTKKLECEMRMRHKNGHYIWTRDMGRIVERDINGNATRIVGGRLNIDVLKRSTEHFTETLDQLEHHKDYLEKEVENRTKALTEQDKMLWAVNDIAQNLFSINHFEDIDEVIASSLERYCNACGKERIALWKNKTINNQPHCSLLYEYTSLEESISFGVNYKEFLGKKDLVKIIEELEIEVTEDEIATLLLDANEEYIPYAKYLPSIHYHFEAGQSLNSLTSSLTGFEKLQMVLRKVKAFIVTPIILDDKIWGFIGMDNCKSAELFSEVEEKMLSIVGFFLANSIQKNESEKHTREAEERVQLMLDATPLCCNLWTPEFKNMTCNEEAVRLFELSAQQEYLDRFMELSPQYQPCGKLSSELSIQYITEAFKVGFCKFEWMHQKLDGTPMPAEITLVRVKYKDGYIVAGYTRDLREFKAMLAELQAKEDDLRAAMDEALLSSKAKSNFLANMSHEIRTPMNAISGFAEIILRESKDKHSGEYAVGIKNACSNLLNIVNDILDISKIESGKLEIVNSQYELSSLMNDVISISRMRLGNKPLMFVTNIDSRLPAKIIGDEIRLKQILINLLSNAIKFTEKGHFSLRVSGEVKGNFAKLCFEISDTGSGIKLEDQERLFAEFERINTTKNRSIEGTGLGLAISKQLCEMMGGKIEVESTFGQGSVFTMTIVQQCPEYQRLSMVEKHKAVLVYESREVHLQSIEETIENLDCKCVSCANQSELMNNINMMQYDLVLTSSMHLKKVKSLMQQNKVYATIAVMADYGETISDDAVQTICFPINCLQMVDLLNGQTNSDQFGVYDRSSYSFIAPLARVLVVDDNPVNLKVAVGLMSPYQLIIDIAENGIKAIEMIKKYQYDLVFMDHMMPEMDGIDATIEIRKLSGEYYRTLPIVALTANALVGTREMFIGEGMNDFLAKPIEIGKLGRILAKWIPNAKKIITSSEIQEKEKNKKLEMKTAGWKLSGINTEQGILSVGGSQEAYLQILASYYTDGSNKRTSLLKHFINQDISAFKTEVHALKSTSATIGALELSEMAAKLEMAAINLDILFIDSNFDEFLLALQNTLDEISHFIDISGRDYREKLSFEERMPADMVVMRDEIGKLYSAAELANIGEIEIILKKLDLFSWPDEVSEELLAIKRHLTMFDYDGVLDCIITIQSLKEILQ